MVENQVIENYSDQLIHINNMNLEYNFQYEEIEVESEQIINQNELIEIQQENQNNYLNNLLEEISSDEEIDYVYENENDNDENYFSQPNDNNDNSQNEYEDNHQNSENDN